MGLWNWLFKRKAPEPSAPIEPVAPKSPRPDGKPDWSDVGIGPNQRHGAPVKLRPKMAHKIEFTLDEEVAQKFNMYASAAYPLEIGGLLRVVEDGPGQYRAIDIRIFPHVTASGTYFELDGQEVAKFNMELVQSGRKDEITEWRSLIHSHPGFSPFLSGTDRDNVKRLAGNRFAFSVICSARREGIGNYYAVHYAQGGPLPLVATDLTQVQCSKPQGIDGLRKKEQEKISEHVRECLPSRPVSTFSYSIVH